AVVFFDLMEDGSHDMHQDEWLISPVLEKAAYLEFSYYIDPRVVENGVHPEYPDHYVVIASTDGGATWSEPLWDARYDASAEDCWHTVTLTLADVPTDAMRVAFRAYGEYQFDEYGDTINQSLYATWAIDDVTIRAAKGQSSLISHFKVALDGEELADHLAECYYVDKSEKTPGEHVYTVSSVAMDGSVSEPVSAEVTLAKIDFVAPRNFNCTAELNEGTGKYTVRMTWDAPETDFQPASYTLYSDNVMHGTGLTAEQGREGVGISGCFGLYEFSIEAVYETPDGVSERVTQRLAMGVRYGVVDLKAESEGKDVVLTWSAPEEDGHTVASYTIYRSGEKLTEGLKETTWRDVAVADGLYEYVVIVVYTDGVESVRTGVSHQVGDEVRVTLPYEEHFNTTFLPVNWHIENQTTRTPDKYTWFFDDQSRLGVKGPGFEGCYAAIDCRNAGYYRLNTTLALPAVDLTTAKDKSDVVLSFYYSYAIGGIFKAGVEFSLDGKEWFLLDMLDKANGFKPEDDGDFHIQKADMHIGRALTAADLAAADVIYLRFRYEATLSNFWAIDNVYVGEDPTAVEKMTEDMDVVVSASAGIMQVRAAQAIRLVEVYALDGRKLAERVGGETSELTMPVPQRGPAVVRVTTAQGVKTVKIYL
ncbi:MAG: choice-of-anchor J domain-containing protein, partial [Bacteroidales bacterium]|nr:choice-of-anchor J domain-containing protein [Bacteroidales bacterium]